MWYRTSPLQDDMKLQGGEIYVKNLPSSKARGPQRRMPLSTEKFLLQETPILNNLRLVSKAFLWTEVFMLCIFFYIWGSFISLTCFYHCKLELNTVKSFFYSERKSIYRILSSSLPSLVLFIWRTLNWHFWILSDWCLKRGQKSPKVF